MVWYVGNDWSSQVMLVGKVKAMVLRRARGLGLDQVVVLAMMMSSDDRGAIPLMTRVEVGVAWAVQ